MRDYGPLEKELGHEFKQRPLLERALTHTTYAHENRKERPEDNARLEFLGDAVIELAVRKHLYDAQTPLPRGKMSEHADTIVNNERLADVAGAIGISAWTDFGKGEENDKLRTNADLQADFLEAVIGAVYEDSDPKTAFAVVIRLFDKHAPSQLRP